MTGPWQYHWHPLKTELCLGGDVAWGKAMLSLGSYSQSSTEPFRPGSRGRSLKGTIKLHGAGRPYVVPAQESVRPCVPHTADSIPHVCHLLIGPPGTKGGGSEEKRGPMSCSGLGWRSTCQRGKLLDLEEDKREAEGQFLYLDTPEFR